MLKRKNWRKLLRKDTGASTVVALYMIIVIFTAFGLGFDIMRAVWLRTNLNNELDIAVAAAAAQTYVDEYGQIQINEEAAKKILNDSYRNSRSLYGGLDCFTGDPNECWIVDSITIKDNILDVKIIDGSKNLWHQFLPDFQPYTVYELESSAVLRNVNQNRFS